MKITKNLESKKKIKNYIILGASLVVLNGCSVIGKTLDITIGIADKSINTLEKTTDPVIDPLYERLPEKYREDYHEPNIYPSDFERLIGEKEKCISGKWKLLHHFDGTKPIYDTYLACRTNDYEHNGRHCYCLDTLIRAEESLQKDKK